MKIFAIYNNFSTLEGNKSLSSTFIKNTPIVHELPDTALLLNHKPFFIPDYATPCSYQASIVYKINRLGRYITPRFAKRYYDSITVGIAFTAENLFKQCVEEGLPWDISKGFDGSAAIGQFVNLTDLTNGLSDTTFTIKEDNKIVQQAKVTDSNFNIDEIVSYISQYYTLRQGDLIYLGFPCNSNIAKIDTQIEALLNNHNVLKFNIK